MTNDGQQPTSRPDSGLRDSGSWVIIDDIEDTPAADSGTPTRPQAPGTPPAPTTPGGWDSFAQATAWNGIPVAPPGKGAAAPPRTGTQRQFGTPSAGSVPGAGQQKYGTADAAPLDSPGLDAATVDPGAPGEDAADVWFPGDGTEAGTYRGAHQNGTPRDAYQDNTPLGAYQDNTPWDAHQNGTPRDAYQDDAPWDPAPARRVSGRRMQWTVSKETLVTVFVACLGVLLVIASAVWHPPAP